MRSKVISWNAHASHTFHQTTERKSHFVCAPTETRWIWKKRQWWTEQKLTPVQHRTWSVLAVPLTGNISHGDGRGCVDQQRWTTLTLCCWRRNPRQTRWRLRTALCRRYIVRPDDVSLESRERDLGKSEARQIKSEIEFTISLWSVYKSKTIKDRANRSPVPTF